MWIFCDQRGQSSLKGVDVRPPIQCNPGLKNSGWRVARHDRQRAAMSSDLV